MGVAEAWEIVRYGGAAGVTFVVIAILFQGKFLRLGREYDDMKSQRNEWHERADAADARAAAAIEEARLAHAALRDALETSRQSLRREIRR